MRCWILRARVLGRSAPSRPWNCPLSRAPSTSLLVVLRRVQRGKEKRPPHCCPPGTLLSQTEFEGVSLQPRGGTQPTCHSPAQQDTESPSQDDTKATRSALSSAMSTCCRADVGCDCGGSAQQGASNSPFPGEPPGPHPPSWGHAGLLWLGRGGVRPS